jgi:hypothetical protein
VKSQTDREVDEASLEMLAARHIAFFLGIELRQRGEGIWQFEWVPAFRCGRSKAIVSRIGTSSLPKAYWINP